MRRRPQGWYVVYNNDGNIVRRDVELPVGYRSKAQRYKAGTTGLKVADEVYLWRVEMVQDVRG